MKKTSFLLLLIFSTTFTLVQAQKALSPKEQVFFQSQEITGYVSENKDSVVIEFPVEWYPLKLKWGYLDLTIHDDSENTISFLPFMETSSICAQIFTIDTCIWELNRNPILTKIVLKQKEEADLTSINQN